MRYRLRTLLILLAVLPPILAVLWPVIERVLRPPVPKAPGNISVFVRVPSGVHDVLYEVQPNRTFNSPAGDPIAQANRTAVDDRVCLLSDVASSSACQHAPVLLRHSEIEE